VRAYELEPENPAIIDSLGWVHYRLGNLAKAIDYLRQAYEAFPDPEVAAHLGEVLWVSGAHDDARKIWAESLDQNPDNPLVIEAMERLTGSIGSTDRQQQPDDSNRDP